jgi:hypothetical protein
MLDWENVFADEVGRKPISVEELYEWLDGLIERLANSLFCNVEETQGASLAVMNSHTLRRYLHGWPPGKPLPAAGGGSRSITGPSPRPSAKQRGRLYRRSRRHLS